MHSRAPLRLQWRTHRAWKDKHKFTHSVDQGYAKLVGLDRSFGIERWYSISNIGFYFDSGLVEMLYVGFSFYKSGV